MWIESIRTALLRIWRLAQQGSVAKLFHFNLFSIFYLLKLINFLTRLLKIINLGKFMSGDYETLEINQPKISYFKKRSEDNTLWLDEMINKIEEMKNNISEAA